jgi:hypothetical protein
MYVITKSNEEVEMVAGDSKNPGASVLYQMWHHARESKVDRRVCWLRAQAQIIVNMH